MYYLQAAVEPSGPTPLNPLLWVQQYTAEALESFQSCFRGDYRAARAACESIASAVRTGSRAGTGGESGTRPWTRR